MLIDFSSKGKTMETAAAWKEGKTSTKSFPETPQHGLVSGYITCT